MREPNHQGVYATDHTVELARHGRSFLRVHVAQCQDGLFRYALEFSTSYVGSGEPITAQGPGFADVRDAEDKALTEAVARFPKAFAGDPPSVHAELKALKAQIEARHLQPSLF